MMRVVARAEGERLEGASCNRVAHWKMIYIVALAVHIVERGEPVQQVFGGACQWD